MIQLAEFDTTCISISIKRDVQHLLFSIQANYVQYTAGGGVIHALANVFSRI